MGCSLVQFRTSIGLYNGGLSGASLYCNFVRVLIKIKRKLNVKSRNNLNVVWVCSLYLTIMLLTCGDIQPNPGPVFYEYCNCGILDYYEKLLQYYLLYS